MSLLAGGDIRHPENEPRPRSHYGWAAGQALPQRHA